MHVPRFGTRLPQTYQFLCRAAAEIGSGQSLAGDLDQETSPARRLGAMDPEHTGGCATAAVDPGSQPGADLGWEVSEQVPRREVNPDTGLGLVGGIGDEEEGIVALHRGQVPIPAAEERAMHRRAEAQSLLR